MLGTPEPRRPRENVGVKTPLHPRNRRPANARRPRVARAQHRDAGFTLIEVMVALIVLVLGVLGAAAMTLTAIRDSKQSGLRSQASALAYEISDVMRANRPVYTTTPPITLAVDTEAVFKGTPPTAGVAACWVAGCSALEMATNDYYEWRQRLTNGLPNGAAVICRDATKLADSFYPACDNAATSPLVVKLRWDEKNNNARDAAVTTGSAPQSVTTRYMVVTIQPY